MNRHYTIFDKTTGRIRQIVCIVPAVLPLMEQDLHPNEAYIESDANLEEDYVLAGRVERRPTPKVDKVSIVADDTDAAVFTDLPDPCFVSIDGQTHEVRGGRLELTTPMSAVYRIVVAESFPWRSLEVEVIAS